MWPPGDSVGLPLNRTRVALAAALAMTAALVATALLPVQNMSPLLSLAQRMVAATMVSRFGILFIFHGLGP